MRRIGVAVAFAVSLLAPVAEGQQTGQVYKIGWLHQGPPPSTTSPFMEVFRQTLRDSGFIEGKNLFFVIRSSDESSLARLRDLATELVHLKVDVLLALDSYAIQTLADATTTIPIVIFSVGDPKEQGLVGSLARPTRNITGLSSRAEQLNVKLLELLKECIPGASRIAVMSTPPIIARSRDEMEMAARSLRVQLQFVQFTSLAELEARFETMKTERADGLVLPAAWFVGRNIRRVAEMALTHRLPTIFWRRDFPEVGGLLAYGPDDTHYWRRLGEMVVKVLKGTKPTDLPIEQVDRFRLAINLKTAKSLGLAIPQTLLLRADQVIQ